MANISAIELLMVSNAMEQLGTPTAPELAKVIDKVGKKISPMIEDRYFAPDVATAKEMILSNLI
jgi:histidine ammonia-lyase